MAIQSANPPELHTLGPWKGLNQQGRRGSIDDDEEWWNENLFAIGPGNLRSCWGHGPPIYAAPAGTQILRIFFGYYGNLPGQFATPPPGRMGWMFLSDGNVDEVDLDTHQVTHIGQIWEPIAPNYWASAKVWRPQFVGEQVNAQITAATWSSGHITFTTAAIHNIPVGQVVTISGVTPAGYNGTYSALTGTTGTTLVVNQPNDPGTYVSGGLASTQILGQKGGVLFGSPKGLYAWDGSLLSSPGDNAPDWLTDQQETDPGAPIFTMPVGLPGIYCMEVYESRLFVAGKNVISFSAPSNGADFSTTDGGGSFGYFGDRLTYAYMDMAQSTGYLYVFGDSSIDLISNVQLSGAGSPESPFTTNMNYQNIDPQVGQRFPRPVGRMGRYFQMFNGAGIFECRGAEASEIGEKVTNVYNTLDTSLYLPTMAPATMFGFRVLLCNGRFTDPFGVTRNLLLMWHPTAGNRFWSIASQNLELTNINSYEQDSIITPYGTDGTQLYQLFAQPDPNLIKHLSSKYIRGGGLSQLTVKNWKRLFIECYDNEGLGVDFTGTFTASAGGIPGGTQDIGFSIPSGARYAMIPQAIQGQGVAGAVDIQSYGPDFTLERLHIVVEGRTLWGA